MRSPRIASLTVVDDSPGIIGQVKEKTELFGVFFVL